MVVCRASKIHGRGVFAKEKIYKNKKVVQYIGEKISRKECLRRDKIYAKKDQLWCFILNNRWAIDAHVGGGIAKYVNHSDKPNCWIDIKNGEIWYRAARTIHPGEELTVHYGCELP